MVKPKAKWSGVGMPVCGLKDYHFQSSLFNIVVFPLFFIELQIENLLFLITFFPCTVLTNALVNRSFFLLYFLRAIQIDWDFNRLFPSAKQIVKSKEATSNGKYIDRIVCVRVREPRQSKDYHIFHCLLLKRALRIVKRILFDKRSNKNENEVKKEEILWQECIHRFITHSRSLSYTTVYNSIIYSLRRTNNKRRAINVCVCSLFYFLFEIFQSEDFR